MLKLPHRVGSRRVKFGRNALTRRVVDKVFAIVKVYNLILMRSHIVTQVDTGGKVQLVVVGHGKFFLIRRNKAVPYMLVNTIRHNKFRTVVRFFVYGLYCAIIEGSVGTAEPRA